LWGWVCHYHTGNTNAFFFIYYTLYRTLLPLGLRNVLKGSCTREALAVIRLAFQWFWGLNSLWKTYQQLLVVFFLLLSWWLSVVKSYVVSVTDEWMSMEHRWNDTGWNKYFEKYPFQYNFVHHKSHWDQSGIEPLHLKWEASD
jgi:hypothetical protein